MLGGGEGIFLPRALSSVNTLFGSPGQVISIGTSLYYPSLTLQNMDPVSIAAGAIAFLRGLR